MKNLEQQEMIITKFEHSLIEDDLYKLEQRRSDILLNIGEHTVKSLEGVNVGHHKKFIENLTCELESVDFLKSAISSWRRNSQGEPNLSEIDSMIFNFWKEYKKVMCDFR